MNEQPVPPAFDLEDQIGFVLRKVLQKQMTILARANSTGLTNMQFMTLLRLAQERGPISQNALGRLVAMDAATTKGVVARLKAQGLVQSEPDTVDRRRYVLSITQAGLGLLTRAVPLMISVSDEMLEPLEPFEADQLLSLLKRLC